VIDIISIDSEGMALFDTQTNRAKNILSTQIGSLDYEPTLGIDLKYFLSEDFKFQNESFKAYLIQILANYSINVSSVSEVIEALFSQLTFELTPPEITGGLIAR
jgi:hypothetical protein